MNLSDLSAVAGLGAVLVGAVVAAVRYVLRSFVATHVTPSISTVSNAIEKNTTATGTLTRALAESNAQQAKGREETHQALTGINTILSDHESRICVAETRIDAGTPRSRPKRAG